MSFGRPLMLIALLAVLLLGALWRVLERRRTDDAARFTAPALLPNLVGNRPGRRRILPFALLLAGIAVLTVAAARPHARVRVPRHEQLAEVISGRLVQLDGVNRTQTMVAFEVFSEHDLDAMFSIGQ